MSNEVASQYAYLANVITQKARKMINDFDSHNQINLLRIRTKKNEIIIAPGKRIFVTFKTSCANETQWIYKCLN